MAAAAAAARNALEKKEKRASIMKNRRMSENHFQVTSDVKPTEQPVEDARKMADKVRKSIVVLQKPKVEEGQPHDGSCLGSRKLPYQDEVLMAYQNKYVVTFVALCIMGNFVVNIVEKEIDPDPDNPKYEKFWSTMDVTFNIIFIFELWANMWSYGGPVSEFWRSGWNVFDTIIVAVGFLTMVNALGPPLDKLKLMRAFRVFRLFKRIPELNKIIMALLNSITPVFYAFVVMFIFFCIYAILAVELFRDFGSGGYYYTTPLNETDPNYEEPIPSITPRGYVHGLEYYGTFMRALYTLFQVMTGESWSEAVARPLLFGLYQNNAFTVGFFFTSFIILMQMVMINVVVAVLLENFVTDSPEDEEEEEALEMEYIEDMKREEPAAAVMAPPVPEPAPAAPASGSSMDALEAKMDLLLKAVAECKTEIKEMRQVQAGVVPVDMHEAPKNEI
mmetsp:Transcript_17628/g.21119  ORF Transcript_17628/g.21119 Transcript_17628/m.21119 type:complete len:447 (-) Transcript_17628:623-1963(-)|eukprot:CAMPEP_0197850766 /NCGR_PEP_ID=MMETSP1438-20131217/16315_1 /TAXON_ID=1461541 /ORGANISM="Pterosperma sp., Strain CCMP1384" /LENGTH=446 /DNA_ID=CAMNT_0043464103 /DNA_START=442 /DNA_END=1782 /DNA_ORIENTATION=-